MARYVTGFCGTGAHEGMKVLSPSGKPLKTCTMIDICKCNHPKCHSMYDKMFETGSMQRYAIDNSGYEPDLGRFKPVPVVVLEAPPVLADAAADAPDDMAALVLTSVAPGIIPPDKAKSFGVTVSGRAARGQLEAMVKRACDDWIVDESGEVPTPQYISDAIVDIFPDVPTGPSTGAITAVLERWVKLGFAKMERKPVRFDGYTEAAIELGLDEMKARAKRAAKMPTAQRRLFGDRV